MSWKWIAAAIFGLALLLAAYEVYPIPMEGLGKLVPKPAALSKFKPSGCGVGSLDKASVTHFYGKIAVDRQALERELAGQGFTRSFEDGNTVYRKPNSGFTTSSVSVRGDGTVTCSASRRKWPWRS